MTLFIVSTFIGLRVSGYCVMLKDINEADLENTRNHLEGLNIVETAQEAGETSPSTPVIMHPLSPITEQQHNNVYDKVSIIRCAPFIGK